ncbi:alpha-amylase family glycosyl hydrolase [Rhodoplanes elegans]|nr:alpha-amylase family glycosyl hydrolase [Rhodoplanes elegans]
MDEEGAAMDALAEHTTSEHSTAGLAPGRPPSWWQTGILYQIYPRSFQDSNGDGIGDLAGILRRLPHLVELGVDALWLSPIFPSPMADFGYDISDYTGIDPIFGSLDDFDALLRAAHAHGLKVLLDLVPNHTSDRHPWFEESRSSRDNPKRDWYIWHDPAPDGGPPTNWLSEFGGSAWEFDPATGQYYYHAFLKAQPDLNWRNPAVREAVHDVMRFWLKRGVDGFRVDVIWHLIKDDAFRDNPPNPDWQPGRPPVESVVPLYTTDRPEVHDVIAGMRRVVEEFDERVLIGEIYLPIERLVAYYGTDLSGAHLPFNFALLNAPWDARRIAQLVEEYEASLPSGGWPNWVLGNHDRPRVGSRIGREQLRVAAMLLLTLRGTPTIYYGEEIGMVDVAIPPDRVRDPYEKNVPGIGVGRDGCRTPMQWERGESAGFTEAEPWLPTAADSEIENVENQRDDAGSLFNLYRRLIALRRRRPALTRGSYEPIAASGDLLVYVRSLDADRVMVALNLGAEPVSLTVRGAVSNGRILVSSSADRDGEEVVGEIYLRSHEGAIVGLDPAP